MSNRVILLFFLVALHRCLPSVTTLSCFVSWIASYLLRASMIVEDISSFNAGTSFCDLVYLSLDTKHFERRFKTKLGGTPSAYAISTSPESNNPITSLQGNLMCADDHFQHHIRRV